jgi:NAD(P)-dependent dehydrogenase (short-subunit alcohol dehydrogenase family)
MSLISSTILITGSSRGLGQKIALSLADESEFIIVNYLNSKDLALSTVRQIKDRGAGAIAIQADVCQWDQVQNLVQLAVKQTGRLDVLINNVGDFIAKPLARTSVAEWQHMMNSNLNSTFYCCRAVLPHMRKNAFGRIINICLANAEYIHSYKHTAAYGIAKTGVLVLSKSLAVEEAAHGITINTISPGLMDNGSLSVLKSSRHISKIPMKRIGQAKDLIAAIKFLSSDEAAYITGTNVIVSGGWGI